MDCGGIAAGADPGRAPPPPFFDQNEAQRAKKNFLGDRALPLSPDLDDPPSPPPPYLKVWICHCADWWEKTLDNEKNDFFHNSNN